MMKKQKGNDFFQLVYEVARHIPKGKITSYGAIAKYLGSARSSRMVGWAMNGSHAQKKYVPAHRVVNRTGALTGKMHFETPTLMRELLEMENIQFNGDVVDMKKHLWIPPVL